MMLRPLHLGLLPGALLLLAAGAHADLKWDTLTADITPRPSDTVAEARFGFVNAGNTPVTIESLKPSCDCAVATLEKTTYAPGERGSLVARYDIGERTGDQAARITVQVKGAAEPVTLTLNVAIPEAAKIDPIMLTWTEGDAPGAKSVTVEAMPGWPLTVNRVSAGPPGFETRVETITEGRKYRVVVVPLKTDKVAFAVVNIEARFADGVKTLRAYAQVRRAPGVPR